MSVRTHERSHFFKYASLATAKSVIKSKSFRWSAPTKFNDPFDHQTGFVLDVNTNEFARMLTDSIERLIFSDIPASSKHLSLFGALIFRLRSKRDRLPRDQILKRLHGSSLKSAANLNGSIGQLNAAIQEHLCHARVFCVSERPDNVVMWSHYANEHRGVVFKLRCIDEIDNTLLVARKVTYTDKFIAFPSAGNYAMHLTGEQPIDIASLCWEIAFTKHIDWSYEREWRVHRPLLDEPSGDGYTIYPENPRIFEAIYLGCRMEENEAASVIELIKRNLPLTKIYRAERSRTAFALSFIEL